MILLKAKLTTHIALFPIVLVIWLIIYFNRNLILINNYHSKLIYTNKSLLPSYNQIDLKTWSSKEKFQLIWRYRPGDNGEPYLTSRPKKQLAWSLNKFKVNIYSSDNIPLDRLIPDYRDARCRSMIYPEQLPSASIVIIFHNEHWTILLRTLTSILNRTPSQLIKEILLIDDFSSTNAIKYYLKNYIARLHSPIKLIRLGQRSGLLRARNFAAKLALGRVLVFLDANVEVGFDWLQPLLTRIGQDRSRVVSPIIDNIDLVDFRFIPSKENFIIGFTWQFMIDRLPLPQREVIRRKGDPAEPIRSPVTNGGIFAVDREFFLRLKGHDHDMAFFSHESVDLSLWTWCCGGSVEIVTCSRIGHIDRPLPYIFPIKHKTMFLRNAGRLVETWFRDYKMFYYLLFPETAAVDRGDLSDRRWHHHHLGCHNFSWYLDNIFPETGFPRYYRSLGQIEHSPTMLCFDARSFYVEQSNVVRMRSCRLQIGADVINYIQMFVYTADGNVRHDNLCLGGSGENEPLTISKCSWSHDQVWDYSAMTGTIRHNQTKLCVTLPEEIDTPILSKCDGDSMEQKFFMRDNLDWDGLHKI